jgi:hypothetical protein
VRPAQPAAEPYAVCTEEVAFVNFRGNQMHKMIFLLILTITLLIAVYRYSYTIELPDTGNHGFVLPASQILPVAKEALAATLAMIQAIKA